jgi:hypothetical protein
MPTIPELAKQLKRLFSEKDGYLHTAETLTASAFRLPVESPERQSLMDQAQDALAWSSSLELQINQGIRDLEKATVAAGWD